MSLSPFYHYNPSPDGRPPTGSAVSCLKKLPKPIGHPELLEISSGIRGRRELGMEGCRIGPRLSVYEETRGILSPPEKKKEECQLAFAVKQTNRLFGRLANFTGGNLTHERRISKTKPENLNQKRKRRTQHKRQLIEGEKKKRKHRDIRLRSGVLEKERLRKKKTARTQKRIHSLLVS